MPRLLESCSLFGDEVVEFFLRDNTITVSISSLDHFLKNSIVSQFSEVLGNFSEVLEGNEAGFLGVEGDEDLVDLISALVVRRSGGHHVEEFIELNLSTAVLVELSNHLINSLGLGFNTEGVDSNLQF